MPGCFSCFKCDKSRGRDENGKIYCDDGRGWIYPKDSCSDHSDNDD